jgi:hypothetical protein
MTTRIQARTRCGNTVLNSEILMPENCVWDGVLEHSGLGGDEKEEAEDNRSDLCTPASTL